MSSLFYADELAEAREIADIVDLFSGPRGWSEGLRRLDRRDIGLEVDRWANATARAAGHLVVECDIAETATVDYVGARGLIASPPCPAFSAAGKGQGRAVLPEILDAVARRDWAWRGHPDPEVWLVVDLGRWIVDLAPEWIALEQVPAVLPVWRAYAELLAELGYSAWAGLLNAADYGVPQTRTRAILMASRARAVSPPAPTHAREPIDGRSRWVTMAEALGWAGRVGFPRLDDLGTSPDGYRERDWRDTDQPAFAVTEKARSWVLNTGRDWKPGGTRADAQTIDLASAPAPALTAKSGGQWHLVGGDWGWTRPATTVLTDPRSWPPGHKVNGDDIARLGDAEARERYGDRAGTEAIRLTIADALALQSFPPDYPVAGTMTKQFEQIGNAIPPRLAWHILRPLVT